MKKILLAVLLVMFGCGLVLAEGAAAPKKEEAKGGDKAKKVVLVNFAKGDQFNNVYGEQSLSEEHLTGKEKMRMKMVASAGGINGLSKNVDWTPFNYVVFNVFLAEDKPLKLGVLIGDKESYAKWSRNYVEANTTLKPGENKDVHINIEGLYCSYASRPLDMKNMQVLQFFTGDAKHEYYFGNLYLVNEEE